MKGGAVNRCFGAHVTCAVTRRGVKEDGRGAECCDTPGTEENGSITQEACRGTRSPVGNYGLEGSTVRRPSSLPIHLGGSYSIPPLPK